MLMLLIKSFHIIAMVAWFAGLFYLPRLFVYHANAHDAISLERFECMERRLFYAIMWPAAIATTGLGIALMQAHPSYYWHQHWMHAKLGCVIMLWIYHGICWHMMKQFANKKNTHSSMFYRIMNEVPTILLITVVILVVVKPLGVFYS